MAHLQSTPLPVNGFSDEWVIGDLIRREEEEEEERIRDALAEGCCCDQWKEGSEV